MIKKLVLPALLLLLISGGFVFWDIQKNPDSVTTRIVLTGPDGLQVTGNYTADGKEFPVREVLPAEITISAKRLSFLVKSSDPSHSVSAEVFVNDKSRVSGSQRHIQIMVTGKTLFSSPRASLRAFFEAPKG
jgi:hypothetical protein